MDSDNNVPGKAGGRIGNPRDFYGAAGLLLLALFVLWAAWDLPGQRGFQLGAGSVPRLFAALLAVNAFLVMVSAVLSRGPAVHYSLPAALVIAGATGLWFAIDAIAGPAVATALLILTAFALFKALNATGIRGPLFIALGILGFAFFIKPLGLFISVYVLVVVSSAASKEFRPLESLLWGGFLSLFCAALFSLLLNLPIPVLPKLPAL